MNRIKELRESRGISQIELADTLGIKSRTYLSMIETGYRPISYRLAKKLSEFFGVSIEDILGSDAIKERYRNSLDNKSVFASSLKDSVNSYEEGLKEYNSKFCHFLLPKKHINEEFKKEEKLYLIVHSLDSYYPNLTSKEFEELYHLISEFLLKREYLSSIKEELSDD